MGQSNPVTKAATNVGNMATGGIGSAVGLTNGKQQAPQQPDYLGAANAQSYGSIQAAIANNAMAQPNINTPLGSQTWNQTGTTSINIPGYGDVAIPKMTQDIKLSPEQQQLYEGTTGLKSNLLGQATSNMGQPVDSSAQGIADKAYGAMTARLDPQWKQNEGMQKTALANQGLAPGGEAYDNAMRVFNQSKNDAYQQANLGAIQTMPQTYQIQQGLRDLPLNEMSALTNAQPVSMPQFQPTQYPGQGAGPNTLGATQAQGAFDTSLYNSQIGQQNAMMQGLMGLGGAGMMAYGLKR